MRAVDFFYACIVLCVLLGAGGYMLHDGNFVFGALVLATAVYHVWHVWRVYRKQER